MDFVIGNGQGFEEKDVILAILQLDLESKVQVVEVIVNDLVGMIDKGDSALASADDKEVGVFAEISLKEIMQSIVKAISNKG